MTFDIFPFILSRYFPKYKLLMTPILVTFPFVSQVFPKGSPLAIDISEAVLKVTGSGQVEQLEKAMLSSLHCSSSPDVEGDGDSIGPEPFSALFEICGGIAVFALIFLVFHVAVKKLRKLSSTQAIFVNILFWRWTYRYLSQSSRRGRCRCRCRCQCSRTCFNQSENCTDDIDHGSTSIIEMA